MTTSRTHLLADATLADEWNLVPSATTPPQTIFLTGATGFLGVYLLSELLHQTTATITCLVRATDEAQAHERLAAQMRFYQLWDDSHASRVRVVVGDLGLPQFGLGASQWEHLTQSLDAIYHNGARVNFMMPYHDLKAANVDGTRTAIQLAHSYRQKPLHYVSTIGVVLTAPQSTVDESYSPSVEHQRSGYAQSKWVSEQLVQQAHERGLPTTIHRIVRVVGHSQTGIFGNEDDMLYTVVQVALRTGIYPDVHSSVLFLPVDYVSKGIIHLAQDPQSWGKVYHFTQAHPPTWANLFEMANLSGYALQPLPLAEWFKQVRDSESRYPHDKAFKRVRLLERFHSGIFEPKLHLEATATTSRLANSGIICPPITPALIATYLRGFA